MTTILTRTVVNSLVWIVCGVLVIIIRTVIWQSASILVWELLGGGMIVYGTAKLFWFLVRSAPTSTPIP